MKKQVLVSVDRGETRVALLEASGSVGARKSTTKSATTRRRRKTSKPAAGYRVAELYLERRGARSIVGNIYKGRVDNVLGGLEAAFVDIGLEKNGFLHVDEIVLPGVEAPRRGRGSGRDSRQITEMLKPGQEIVVQVVKDPLKTKGARLSMDLTIAGRYMVYAPYGEGVGVSRRLDDGERERLRKEAAKLDLKGAGAIVRTAAQGAMRADLERELLYLFKLNEVLQKRVAETTAPALVFQEADLSVRVVRDIYSSAFERAIVDDPKQYHRLVSFFSRTAPELVDQVELWEEDQPLFEAFGVEQVLDSTLSRRVDLPSGGYLMIDYAEALTVIDVNSGSFVGRGKAARLEDTITKTNLEAADEVVRQLRLRDIGGIIVIDFIDMARARNRDAVLKVLRGCVGRGPDQDVRGRDLAARAGRDDPAERDRRRARDHDPAVPDLRRRGRDQVRGDARDRVRAADARPCQGDQGRGAADPDEPSRERRVHPRRTRGCCARSRRRPASGSTSRAPRGCRSITSRSCSKTI